MIDGTWRMPAIPYYGYSATREESMAELKARWVG
jgi:hypothetical protein